MEIKYLLVLIVGFVMGWVSRWISAYMEFKRLIKKRVMEKNFMLDVNSDKEWEDMETEVRDHVNRYLKEMRQVYEEYEETDI